MYQISKTFNDRNHGSEFKETTENLFSNIVSEDKTKLVEWLLNDQNHEYQIHSFSFWDGNRVSSKQIEEFDFGTYKDNLSLKFYGEPKDNYWEHSVVFHFSEIKKSNLT